MIAIKKKVWKVKYRGPDANTTEKEIITSGYESLAAWLEKRIWVGTITSVTLDREIIELVENRNAPLDILT